jgi:hypothetical protein
MLKLLAIIILTILSGCANVQLQDANIKPFDTSTYSNRVGVSATSIKSVNVKLTATPMLKPECPDNKCYSEGARLPIETPIELGKQIQADIHTYLGQAFKLDENSNRIINVSIYNAQAYKNQRMPGASWIPIVGLFVPPDYKIGLFIGIAISVYDGSQLVKDYRFDRRIEMVDPINSDSKDVYAKALEEYRRVLFSDIDREVLATLASPKAIGTIQQGSISEELKKLAAMRDSGVLSESEFIKAKAALLP